MTDKATSLCERLRKTATLAYAWADNSQSDNLALRCAGNLREAADLIEQQAATIEAMGGAISWIEPPFAEQWQGG